VRALVGALIGIDARLLSYQAHVAARLEVRTDERCRSWLLVVARAMVGSDCEHP